MQTGRVIAGVVACVGLGAGAQAQTTLGSFIFDDNKFGDTLTESDGGSHSSGNWLNTTNANPGNPGYLTGAHFETGVANMGAGTIDYTIGYASGIPNMTGDDMGIVVARYSTDNVEIRFSTDGVTFGPWTFPGSGTAVDSGEDRTYYYGGGGPYPARLWVHPIDLSDYGIGAGGIMAIGIRTGGGSGELDLIRAAGFIPSPSTVALVGAAGLLAGRRRRHG